MTQQINFRKKSGRKNLKIENLGKKEVAATASQKLPKTKKGRTKIRKTEHLGKKELAATARQRLPPQKKTKIPRTLLEVFGT